MLEPAGGSRRLGPALKTLPCLFLFLYSLSAVRSVPSLYAFAVTIFCPRI